MKLRIIWTTLFMMGILSLVISCTTAFGRVPCISPQSLCDEREEVGTSLGQEVSKMLKLLDMDEMVEEATHGQDFNEKERKILRNLLEEFRLHWVLDSCSCSKKAEEDGKWLADLQEKTRDSFTSEKADFLTDWLERRKEEVEACGARISERSLAISADALKQAKVYTGNAQELGKKLRKGVDKERTDACQGHQVLHKGSRQAA